MDAAQLRILLQEGLVTSEQLQQVTQVTRSGDLCSELTRLGWLSADQARRVRQLASAAEDELPLMPHAPAAFQIDRLLGKGGMGEVYAVRDRRMGREAALKLISTEDLRPEMVQRFAREARTLARLNHPGIPAVYEFGLTQSRQPYLLMALIRGRTLSDLLIELNNQGSVSKERNRLLEIFLKICDTVAAAHEKGIIHRDLKPDNIMIGDCGEVYVMDWGLTRKREAVGALSNSQIASQKVSLTQAGAVLGTLGYMSPEQANGESVEFEADVFALGSILFELMSGEPAIPQAAPFEMMQRTIHGRFPRLRELDPAQPAELDDIIARAMVTDPGRRTATVALLAAQLRDWRESQKPSPETRSALLPWVLASSVALACLLGAFAWTRFERGRLQVEAEEWSSSLERLKGELTLKQEILAEKSKSAEALDRRNHVLQELPKLYRDLPKSSFDSVPIVAKLENLAKEAETDPDQSREVGELALRLLDFQPKARDLAIGCFTRSLQRRPEQAELHFYLDRLENGGPLNEACAERVLRKVKEVSASLDEQSPVIAFLYALRGPKSEPRYKELLLRARDFPAAASWASLELAAISTTRDEVEDARRYRRDAILTDPTSAQLWHELARQEQEKGRIWVAIAYNAAALELDPRAEAILDQAVLLIGHSQLKDQSSEILRWAGSLLEQARVLEVKTPGTSANGLRRSIQARQAQWIYYSGSDQGKALGILDRLLPAKPEEGHLQAVQGHLAFELRRYENAIESSRRAIQANLPDRNWSYFTIVLSLMRLKRYEEAAIWAQKAVASEPFAIPLGIQSASALRLSGRIQESESLAKKLLLLDSINANVMLELGLGQLFLGQFENASKSFEGAFLASDRKNFYAFEATINALIQSKRAKDALLFIRSNPEFRQNAGQAAGMEAYALMALDRKEEACELLELALRIDIENVQNRRLYADCLYQLNRHEDSLRVVAALLKRTPNDIDCLFLKADALIALNRHDEAREVLDYLDSENFPPEARQKAREQRSRSKR